MQSKSCVYWIHLPEHTDIFTQGYVGVAVGGSAKRFREHKSSAKSGSNLHIHNAIRKYGNELVVEDIIRAPIEYCYDLENKLRPLPNIGYNLSVGGASVNLGSKRSEDCRAKMSSDRKGVKPTEIALANMRLAAKSKIYRHSDEARNKISNSAKMRDNSINVAKAAIKNSLLCPWQNPAAKKEVWFFAREIYSLIKGDSTLGTRNLSKIVDFKYSQLAVIHKKIKAGWNPDEDTEWLIFSSELTPETSGDKLNHPGI